MKRLIAKLGVIALALTIPSVALAHSHKRHSGHASAHALTKKAPKKHSKHHHGGKKHHKKK
jgi:hypothetical protein